MALLALLAVPSGAEAQGWLSDRQRTEGPGFRLGDFELHPGVGVEVGYDSNLYYSEDEDASTYRDSGILRATAHLMFSTRGRQRRQEGESGQGGGGEGGQPTVTFRGGVAGSFYHFFNDTSRTNMEVDANLALGILPGRPFSITITEQFGRSVRPFTENFDASVSHARIRNDAGLRLNFATTGQVLRISAGYNFILDYFEDAQFAYGNNFRHRLTLEEQFRFLPQTAIIHRTGVTILDYFDEGARASALVNDGVLLNTQIGLNGAFTNEFSVLAMVGYGAGFYSSRTPGVYQQDYESVVAQVEARWQISETIRLSFGYDRSFQPSYIGNFYRQDRGYANYQMMIDGAFLVGIDASFGYYEFGAIVEPDGTTPIGSSTFRGDYRLRASLFGEYRFTDWLGVNGTLAYTGNFTDYSYRVEAGAMLPPIVDPAQFNKFEAWFGVRVFY